MAPQRLALVGGADRRVDLGESDEARDVVLAQSEIVDTSLDRRLVTLRPVRRGQLVPTRYGAMDDVSGTTGSRPQLIDLRSRKRLGDRRPSEPVRGKARVAGRTNTLRHGAHRLVILVVHACHKAMLGNGRETIVHEVRCYPGEALRVGSECREFERRGASGNQAVYLGGPMLRIDGRVQSKVDASLPGSLPRPCGSGVRAYRSSRRRRTACRRLWSPHQPRHCVSTR